MTDSYLWDAKNVLAISNIGLVLSSLLLMGLLLVDDSDILVCFRHLHLPGKELLPTKMSPNSVFDKATAIIRQNREVQQRFGDGFKTYGRDHGGHREGRRNFIEHTEYVSQDDGSKRTRVRFNLDGPYGQAFVFAEVSNDMPSGEFVYILVQDKRNGQVITVQDNRSSLLAKRLAGGSQDGQDVFAQLLGGGKK